MNKKETIFSLLTIIFASVILGMCIEKMQNKAISCEYIANLGNYYACFVKVEED